MVGCGGDRGPEGVRKDTTAQQRAETVLRLDDSAQRELSAADPGRLVRGVPPILIDEWQRLPESWDVVRRAVDDDPSPGRFLLPGPATPHPEKHHLADPGLAAILLGVDVDGLLEGEAGALRMPRDGTLLGHLFESLVTQSVRVYAQLAEAGVKHLRTKSGRQEVDLIVERPDRRVVAIEVKLARSVSGADVAHLHWLREKLGEDLLDAAVVTAGPDAYRRSDGVAVIPAALLGP